MANEIRCGWCGSDPLYVKYHDEEWGKPVYDDKILFEFLLLEGAQAGLSWITILKEGKVTERPLQILMCKRWPPLMKRMKKD